MGDAAAPVRFIYVLSDGSGFVGAFGSRHTLNEVVRAHPLIPFLTQVFLLSPGPAESVWVVLYRDIDAVAFVSNDRAAAMERQALLNQVGLSYSDDIDYWEQPVDKVNAVVTERLKTLGRVHTIYAGTAEADALRQMEADDVRRLDQLMAPLPNGPIERLLRENLRSSIFDSVTMCVAKTPEVYDPCAPEAEAAQTEPAQTEPAQAEPAQAEPAQTEPAQTEPAQTEPAPEQAELAAPKRVEQPELATTAHHC